MMLNAQPTGLSTKEVADELILLEMAQNPIVSSESP